MKAGTATGILLALLVLAVPQAASAYIGPGAGLSVGGAIVGVFIALLMAAAVILLWPLRLAMRRLRRARASAAQSVHDHPGEPGQPAS